MKDHTGDSIIAKNAQWSFGGDVSKKFDEHVSRSVPLYNQGHDLIAKISDFFISRNSTCYDLGCSTGKLVQLIAERNKDKGAKFIAIDSEKNMVLKATKQCKNFSNVRVMKANLLDVEFEKADMIVSYYTMQFIKPKNRQIIFDRIFKALNWGGAFLLFEKVRSPDARFQDIMLALYTDYKIDNGYTADEILTKARSLKGVLEPFSTQGNIDLLKRAGFVDIMTIMKYVCFEGFLAIK